MASVAAVVLGRVGVLLGPPQLLEPQQAELERARIGARVLLLAGLLNALAGGRVCSQLLPAPSASLGLLAGARLVLGFGPKGLENARRRHVKRLVRTTWLQCVSVSVSVSVFVLVFVSGFNACVLVRYAFQLAANSSLAVHNQYKDTHKCQLDLLLGSRFTTGSSQISLYVSLSI